MKPILEYAGRRFTMRQGQLFALLMGAEGRELQREYLIDQMYDDERPTRRAIDVYIRRIRKKLAGTDIQIHSYQTGGYQLLRGVPGQISGRDLLHPSRWAG